MTEKLAYTKIKADGGTQMRAGLNQEIAGDYADTMRRNNSYDPFPPVIVYFDGTHYWLGDGFHRHNAAFQAFGSSCTIPADVRAGTRRDAILHAAGANAGHGLQRTNADKRRAVMTLLRDEEWAKWSDREIARRCSVHHEMVGSLRKTSLAESASESTERTYTTKHGTTATMQTANIGAQHRPPPPTSQPAQRTYESAIPAVSPPTVDRRSPAPTARPLDDNEVEAVVWRAIAHHAKSGMSHHKLAWLQRATVGDFSRLLNPGVSFEAEQLARIRAKVEAELSQKAEPVTPIVEPELEPEQDLGKDSDEWYTPPYVIEAARSVLGKIDLDPASCALAQTVVKATVYLTRANDSLQSHIPWLGRVWLNPIFSNPGPFTNKLIEEYEAGRTKAAILLTNNGTETAWGQALLSRPYPTCFVGSHEGRGTRIAFWKHDPDEPKTGNRYAQMIFYLGKEPEKFREVFSQFGAIR